MRVLHALVGSVILIPAAVLAGTPQPHSDGKVLPKPAIAANAAPVSFRESVEPYFKAHCTTCHSSVAHSSGFDLEVPGNLFKGGSKSGAKVIVPGNASASALVAYLRGTKQPKMPMNGEAASETQIKLIETWINQGAKVDTVKLGWPYTPPVASPAPKVKDAAWVRNPIDSFVLTKLEANGLKPAPPASRVALLRRVYADLVGETPTPEEASVFLNDSSPQAYEKLVDRLLADPRYGERWARHWLDLVRYSDSDGFEGDNTRPRAWRFRDYVIRSFNADKPYDRFLKEQIAGDELYPNDGDAIIATGYARLAPWDSLSTDHPQRWQDFLNDVTDTTGAVVLGLTVGCAKCHTHKYDPITQADYYRMQAFFTPLQWRETRLPDSSLANEPASLREKVADAKAHLEPLQKQMKAMVDLHRDEVLSEKQAKAKPGQTVTVSDDEIERAIRKTKDREFNQLRGEIEHWQRELQPLEPVAEAIGDSGRTSKPTYLLLRGALATPGPEVQPGFVAALSGGEEKPATITPSEKSNSTGRRSALANWLASTDNPMTARVMVNRIWQHHFGRGIVGTPSDFGKNGDRPTHPELLDWLSVKFVEEGWSIKKMHRLMLLSNTYQMSTQVNPISMKISMKLDPTNKLFWRMNRIRLEGEALRDSILTVSGRLNPAAGGPGVFPKVSDEVLSTGSTHKWGNSPDEEGRRRTVYVFQRRSLFLPIVEAFDGPDMVNSCSRRTTTTIAPQALALFNGDFSREESRYFAGRVQKIAGEDLDRQIQTAYQLALVRKPTPGQTTLALDYIQKQTRFHLTDSNRATGRPGPSSSAGDAIDPRKLKEAQSAALADFCHVLINTNEFLYLD